MPPIVWPHTFHDGVGEQASGVQVMENLNALQPEPWKSIATFLGYLNSWTDYEPTRKGEYRKTPWGVVELRGVIKGGTSATVAFVLPAGYRPTAIRAPAVACNAGVSELVINPAGEVLIAQITGEVKILTYLEAAFSVE